VLSRPGSSSLTSRADKESSQRAYTSATWSLNDVEFDHEDYDRERWPVTCALLMLGGQRAVKADRKGKQA
jgi:hypothetical protein